MGIDMGPFIVIVVFIAFIAFGLKLKTPKLQHSHHSKKQYVKICPDCKWANPKTAEMCQTFRCWHDLTNIPARRLESEEK